MARVYLDSCVVIYLHEAEADLQSAIRDRLLPVTGDGPSLNVSDLTRLECRVHPLKRGDASLLAEYDRFFELPEILKVGLGTEVFDLATELRARHGLRTPDALHLAAALAGECEEFWTNDNRLAKVQAGIAVEIVS